MAGRGPAITGRIQLIALALGDRARAAVRRGLLHRYRLAFRTAAHFLLDDALLVTRGWRLTDAHADARNLHGHLRLRGHRRERREGRSCRYQEKPAFHGASPCLPAS